MPAIGYQMGSKESHPEYSARLKATTRRTLLVNGVLALAAISASASASSLEEPAEHVCLDANAKQGEPGYYDGMVAGYAWAIYLDDELLNPGAGTGSYRGPYIRGLDTRAGYVDIYKIGRDGNLCVDFGIERRYGRVRVIRGERY